jgi:hypothetical protein
MYHSKSTKQLKKDWKLTTASLCLILIVALGIIISISSLPSVKANTIEKIGVGVYQDQNCQKTYDQIKWGTIDLGAAISQTIYLKNEQDYPAQFSLLASGWTPTSASKYLTLSWNYSGQRIDPGQVILVELTLTLSENAIDLTDFSFNIRISANK